MISDERGRHRETTKYSWVQQSGNLQLPSNCVCTRIIETVSFIYIQKYVIYICTIIIIWNDSEMYRKIPARQNACVLTECRRDYMSSDAWGCLRCKSYIVASAPSQNSKYGVCFGDRIIYTHMYNIYLSRSLVACGEIDGRTWYTLCVYILLPKLGKNCHLQLWNCRCFCSL